MLDFFIGAVKDGFSLLLSLTVVTVIVLAICAVVALAMHFWDTAKLQKTKWRAYTEYCRKRELRRCISSWRKYKKDTACIVTHFAGNI